MKPSPHRPLAWRLAIAILVLMFANAASAQNQNANRSAANPAASATGGVAQPPAGGASKPNGEPARPNPPTDGAANPASAPAKTDTTPAPQNVTVKEASNADPSLKGDASKQVALRERLKVIVSDRKALLGNPADLSKLTLLLNSYPMKGIPIYLGTEDNELLFDLVPPDNALSNLSNDDDKKKMNETWNALLSDTGGFPPSPRQVTVSVSKDGVPLSSGDTSIKLQVVNNKLFWVYVVVLALAIALFIYLARRSNLIRDSGPEPKDQDGNRLLINGKLAQKTYSLARTQFAFWSFIIIGAYAFIWMVTTNQNTLNSFTLGIFGISAATTAIATVMDKNKRTAAETTIATLKQQGNAEAANNVTPPAGGAGGAAAAPVLAANQPMTNAEKIAALDAATRPDASKGFWTDILSDDNGITIHRFQIVAWTIVLGIIFIATVSKTLTMPNFDNTLLALMGISSGTYIGLKPTESQSGGSNA